MINWRKPVIYGLLYLTRNKIPKYLKEIKRIEKLPREEIKKYQKEKLKKILLHAYKNVPYYHKVLANTKVVIDGEVNLGNFDKIPILTKEIMRKEGKNLYSKDYKKRKSYENTSGGSSGEPVIFIQDKYYDEWNIATKIFFAYKLGKEIGEKELKVWGSERDIIEGSVGIYQKTLNYLYNRKFLNSFMMTEEDMIHYVNEINKFKPQCIWCYVDSIFILSKFIDKNKLKVFSPESIITTAGVLSKEIKDFVERVFKTRVYNQYGSREVGGIALEFNEGKGLEVFQFSQFVELINIQDNNGKIIITNLNNYSMPLIRYKIGDTSDINSKLSAYQGLDTLDNISGRTTNHFIKKDNTLVHGEYFTHLFYFKDWIKKFQVIQNDYDLIICNLVLEKEKNEKDMKDIEDKIKLVMGKSCKVEFNFVKEIKPTKSGKFLYTICEVK